MMPPTPHGARRPAREGRKEGSNSLRETSPSTAPPRARAWAHSARAPHSHSRTLSIRGHQTPGHGHTGYRGTGQIQRSKGMCHGNTAGHPHCLAGGKARGPTLLPDGAGGGGTPRAGAGRAGAAEEGAGGQGVAAGLEGPLSCLHPRQATGSLQGFGREDRSQICFVERGAT